MLHTERAASLSDVLDRRADIDIAEVFSSVDDNSFGVFWFGVWVFFYFIGGYECLKVQRSKCWLLGSNVPRNLAAVN